MAIVRCLREELIAYLRSLQGEICEAFERFEPLKRFERKEWSYKEEGGGEMAILRGDCFEKAAVNWSGVGGSRFPMGDAEGGFFATGVSLITHMSNPHVPTVHMNVRYIEAGDRHWFGGGYDLTPMGFPYDEDTEHFHQIAKKALDPLDPMLYPEFSAAARDYFTIPHYGCERGVGGLFFDHYNTGNFEADLAVWKAVAGSFLAAYLPLLQRRIEMPFTAEQRERQLYARARYAEFNLLYDRGTKFGFQSGGNPEAILCSMPPLVRW